MNQENNKNGISRKEQFKSHTLESATFDYRVQAKEKFKLNVLAKFQIQTKRARVI